MKFGPAVMIGILLAPLSCREAVENQATGDSSTTSNSGPRTPGDGDSGPAEGRAAGDAPNSASESQADEDGQDSGTLTASTDSETRYLRRAGGVDDERVETAIARFERDDGVVVDLFAEVHIAEPSHYREVQERLRAYDAVLYELVADPDNLPTGDTTERRSILSAFQGLIGSRLGLGFQLEELDYHQDNFVHADFTPGQFAEAMEAGGETPWTLVMKALSGGSSLADLEDAGVEIEPIDFVAAARQNQLGLAWRKQLTQILLQMNIVQDVLSGTVLLDGRNRQAIDVLKAQIGLGKKTFAIHYGGAHMPGIERILVDELGFRRTRTDWVRAWGLTEDSMPKSADPKSNDPNSSDDQARDR